MLEKLRVAAANCKNCELWRTRNNSVFEDGNQKAKIMLIGEAPGADEDKMGKPFVGRAGKLLNEFLQNAGIDRQRDLYIANTLKCRPPENRKPKPEEKSACEGFLFEQIRQVKPKVIVLCGATSMESFLGKKQKITTSRGHVFENVEGFPDIKFVPILHPSYLLRKHSTEPDAPRALTLNDLKEIKKIALE